MYKILVVEDEKEIRDFLVRTLTEHNYQVYEAKDGEAACEKIQELNFKLIICDVKLPKKNGLELLQCVKEHFKKSISFVFITAHGNISDAVFAIKNGAFDYLEKPIEKQQILSIVDKAKTAYTMLTRAVYTKPLTPSIVDQQQFQSILEGKLGVGDEIQKIQNLIARLSNLNTSVLIRGENGTGKELVARAIHSNGERKNYPFVAINCAALPDNLIESELFGHEKGAFTGAEVRKIGKFQFANKGTIFLDEIGDTTPAFQVKLLRVLQEHVFSPVGSNLEIKSEARVIAATNQDLEKKIQEGTFREDLYYRLNIIPIFLPPLRERIDEIDFLVLQLISKLNLEYNKSILGISSEVRDVFTSYSWPGNIRELENILEYGFVMETSNIIMLTSLPEYIREAHVATKITMTTHQENQSHDLVHYQHNTKNREFQNLNWEKYKEFFERAFIIEALRHNEGKINQASLFSKIPKNTLMRKIKKYRISPKEYLIHSM